MPRMELHGGRSVWAGRARATRIPKLRVVVVACLALLAAGSGTSLAERTQDGNVIVFLNGGISPKTLPRDHHAPVAVYLAGRLKTTGGIPLPRVNWIRLELSWRGRLRRTGLAVCPESRIRYATSSAAMERCGEAFVGRGRIFAKVFVPRQDGFPVRARLLAFNGQGKKGSPKVLVHAYATDPPVSFVIPFAVHRRRGKTVLITTIRRSVGPWPRVANFSVKVSRHFRHRGRWHSYLSASCPLPDRFTAGFLSFARATYGLSTGQEIEVESVRSCRAR